MRYLPHTDEDIASMLKVVGADTLDDLFSTIPDDCRRPRDLDIPDALTEWELNGLMKTLSSSVAISPEYKLFLGAGRYDHFIPAEGLSKDEWTAQRQIRLENPQFIRLNVENIDIIVVDTHVASVFFSQHYESDRLNDTVSKNFIIRKGGGQWRIFQENLVR